MKCSMNVSYCPNLWSPSTQNFFLFSTFLYKVGDTLLERINNKQGSTSIYPLVFYYIENAKVKSWS